MKSSIFVCFLLPLLACGGGGDSSEPNNIPPPSTVAKINQANAAEVVADSFSAFSGLESLDNLTLVNPQMTSQSSVFQRQSLLPITYCGEDPATDTGNGAMDISISGNFITTLNILVIFEQCALEPTITADGRYEFDLITGGEFGPGLGDGSHTITQTFGELSVTDSEQNLAASFDGNVVSVTEYTAPVFSWEQLINLDIDATNGSLTFVDWQKDLALNTDTGQLALNISGNFTASDHNASFTFMMLEPIIFEAVLVDESLEASVVLSGKFRITADDNSSVTVTILSPTLARLEIDLNGDGIIDITIDVEIDDLNIFESIDN
jgi:hypothetical protein